MGKGLEVGVGGGRPRVPAGGQSREGDLAGASWAEKPPPAPSGFPSPPLTPRVSKGAVLVVKRMQIIAKNNQKTQEY